MSFVTISWLLKKLINKINVFFTYYILKYYSLRPIIIITLIVGMRFEKYKEKLFEKLGKYENYFFILIL